MKHALYGKVMRKSKKVKVHDEHNECSVGDLILIMETRRSPPPSGGVVEILEKAK